MLERDLRFLRRSPHIVAVIPRYSYLQVMRFLGPLAGPATMGAVRERFWHVQGVELAAVLFSWLRRDKGA